MEFQMMLIAIAVGICIGIVLGERYQRRAVLEEMRDERHVLKDLLRQISETHNSLVATQKMQDETMHDLRQKVEFMVQGVKGR